MLEDLIKKDYSIKFYKGSIIGIIVFAFIIFVNLQVLIDDVAINANIPTYFIIILSVLIPIICKVFLYTFIYLSFYIANKLAIYKIKKDGIYDEINEELEKLSNDKIEKGKEQGYINTENYSIIFSESLIVFKHEDVKRLFYVTGVKRSYRNANSSRVEKWKTI